MEAVLQSALLVFVGEMGDKTQLLSLVLVAKYKKPWLILFGVLVATLANHALAAMVGGFAAANVPEQTMRWILGATFLFFAAWILVPDKEGEVKNTSKFGVFVTTVVSFFIAEMGDKTQLATVALAAKYSNVLSVTIGSTVGMLASNALAVFLGERLLRKIPMKYVRIFAALLFALFGFGILFGIGGSTF